jgi:hypothetical protein
LFSFGQSIVVVSSTLNKTTARVILKRLKLSADPEWLHAAQISLIPLKDASSDDHANEFLRTVLAACRSL